MRLAPGLFAIIVAACSGPKPSAPVSPVDPPPAPAPSVKPALPASLPSSRPSIKVTLADVGLEAGSLDRSVDPCVDFYQFACGGWLAANDVPADRARWARASALDEKNKAAIKVLLEEAAKGIGATPPARKLGDYYASCMDESAIENAGLASIKPLLDKASKQIDAKTWLATTIELHKLGVWVVWGATAFADLKDSTTTVTYLDAAGLGLPDRDYYVKPDFKDKLDAYRAHVARLLVLAGTPEAKATTAAADVLAIETEIAKLTRTSVEKRDIGAMYNPTDLKGLGKQAKSIDWKRYFQGVGYAPSKKLVIATPRFFAALDKLRAKFKPAQWSSYFTYHLVEHAAFQLPKKFDDEAFELTKVLSGVEQQQERSKRCIEATQDALGELLGQLYVAKYFPSSARQAATSLIDTLVRALEEDITKLEWMSDATKQTAQAKLAKLVRMVGYPDKWRTYDFEVRRDDFAGNRLRSNAFETLRVLGRSGKPVDRSEWGMDTYRVDAYYNPTANNTVLPAGILQPPFFGEDRSIAANLGGIGVVIGREITHGFDDQGAQFDGDGNHKNWWQETDATKFAERGKCLAQQYATFEALPKSFVNGELTLGENIADLGGVKVAFNAYTALRADANKVYLADGFTEDQQFFIAVAQSWCAKERPAETQRRLNTDVHAPSKFRVYGALRNLPEFAKAFSCTAGTPMNPTKPCSVW
ncbi:MAG: M13 family metallopeptidase [Kofleriaceae bacterium]|nr:M13 family metallopeptidase [Kofleriaceae bacterium]